MNMIHTLTTLAQDELEVSRMMGKVVGGIIVLIVVIVVIKLVMKKRK
jgi:hypothetical protein